ncbi:substrate-binding periplasmic protein [Kiloniella laminariae]|uniref:substrate-binding periplasmic protein n=1 Tax=Kiloniella laminariae TaxID=454162 RepID=UPI0003638C93|nr:transporter substrate-binding domain-containing protein [Kiloniella laminariae]
MPYFVQPEKIAAQKRSKISIIKTSLICFSLSGFVFNPPQPATAADDITILAVHFPPFEFEKPEKGLKGFDVETVVEAFARKDIKAGISFMPWARALEKGRKGQAAGILSCAKNSTREQYFIHSDPISFATRGYTALEKRGLSRISETKDGAAYTVGSIIGYASTTELKTAGIKPDLSPDLATALEKLRKGRIDLLFGEINATEYMAQKIIPDVTLISYPTSQKAYHLCLSRNWPGSDELLNHFNEGLAEVQSDGTDDQIHAKYR